MKINRRDLLATSAKMGIAASVTALSPTTSFALETHHGVALSPLHPPAKGPITVAFLISEGAEVMDFAGPWEVFQDVENPKTKQNAFKLYMVAETKKPIAVGGGMKIVPDFTLRQSPRPNIVVIPAQMGESAAMVNWIRECSRHADLIMSVCNGAFLLAKTGLLDGKTATAHYGGCKMLALTYPKVRVQREARYVESGNIACSGGVAAGIDLALRVVARYFGVDVAEKTASNMEYTGRAWLNPNEVSDLYVRIKKHRKPPFCPVCDVGVGKSISYPFKGQTYYFCGQGCKTRFVASPEKYLAPYR